MNICHVNSNLKQSRLSRIIAIIYTNDQVSRKYSVACTVRVVICTYKHIETRICYTIYSFVIVYTESCHFEDLGCSQ